MITVTISLSLADVIFTLSLICTFVRSIILPHCHSLNSSPPLYVNLRSHRSIFEVSSRLFYGGALEECAEHTLINSLTSFQPLPRDKSFPVLFIGTYVCTYSNFHFHPCVVGSSVSILFLVIFCMPTCSFMLRPLQRDCSKPLWSFEYICWCIVHYCWLPHQADLPSPNSSLIFPLPSLITPLPLYLPSLPFNLPSLPFYRRSWWPALPRTGLSLLLQSIWSTSHRRRPAYRLYRG